MHPPDWTRLDTGGAARGQQPPRRVAGVNLGAPKPQPRPPPATEAPSTSSAPADQRLSLSKHFAHAVHKHRLRRPRWACRWQRSQEDPSRLQKCPRPESSSPLSQIRPPAGQGLPTPAGAREHPVLLDRAPVRGCSCLPVRNFAHLSLVTST
ncbi:hypothetical protein ZWY2020_010367 [Hordeum vulgare]|nr:hypothetical protein ZWY2020_010367 [Hordeum vulgare]